MSKKPTADRNRDNSLPPPPGSGPRPETDERAVRSARLRLRDLESVGPANGPDEVEDAAERRIEQLEEYHRRLRGTGANH